MTLRTDLCQYCKARLCVHFKPFDGKCCPNKDCYLKITKTDFEINLEHQRKKLEHLIFILLDNNR